MTAAAVCSRDVSAGIRPDPGAAAAVRHRHPRHAAILRWAHRPAPAWWSRSDWLAEVADALTPEVCREFSVARDTALAVARGHAEHADHRTGRGCRPTNARLVELARVSLSTVQRARRALEALGLVRRLVEGRSAMTRSERLAAWRRGSSHRQVAAEFALCSLRRLAPKRGLAKVREVAGFVGADLQSVDGDTPPGANKVGYLSHLGKNSLRRRTETKIRAPRGAHTEKGHDGPTRRLAADVGRRLRWLSAVSTRRTSPALARFARAGWTVRDVELAVRDALAARGWRVPTTFRQSPAAYLAKLLRDLDPADRPTAAEEWARASQRAEDEWARQVRTSTVECPHGQHGGHLPSPTRGWMTCPDCRREATS